METPKGLVTASYLSIVTGVIFLPVCQSFCSQGVSASVHAGIHPPGKYTPQADTPPGQVHPLGRYTTQVGKPPGRYTLLGRYTPWAGTQPRQVNPLAGTQTPGQVHPAGQLHPWAGNTPLPTTVTAADGTHLNGPKIPFY